MAEGGGGGMPRPTVPVYRGVNGKCGSLFGVVQVIFWHNLCAAENLSTLFVALRVFVTLHIWAQPETA
jgi:hypothetical protein